MLKHASFLAIVAVHTAEKEAPKVLKNIKTILFKKPQEDVSMPRVEVFASMDIPQQKA